ncbi:SPOSA6832_04088 [Sporobolomyces salmonicolor]|uniref:SPOSA6832_04088-mRNA-1:cds n=1 Tax=Sporidiobolus salmonicolor TaxID=5005 RepID=A0A0D6EQP4_SPOSA|nr:SPOSA6832_04088 [Sporobolomyces salmonicolor]
MAPSNAAPSFSSAHALLRAFSYERTLSEDSRALVVYLLGTAIPEGSDERVPAILKVEKTPYAPDTRFGGGLESSGHGEWSILQLGRNGVTCNDIYSTSLAWFAPGRSNADIQLSSICPATEKHIQKYSQQESRLISETPELYEQVVKPYIEGLDAKSISWVYNILEGTAEAENVLLRDDDPQTGFVLTPDLKWDQKTMSALYLLVLTQDRTIRSLRDLRPSHLPLLRKIRHESERVAMERYGIDKGELRFFVHYQPTYCALGRSRLAAACLVLTFFLRPQTISTFTSCVCFSRARFRLCLSHPATSVLISFVPFLSQVHLNYVNFSGITVGQAHLLDDVIDALELEASSPPEAGRGQTFFERKTFTYALGKKHALYQGLAERP